MNLIEKLHALMVSQDIRVWHYPYAKETPFEYGYNGEAFRFDTLEEMIEAAYSRIDPLRKPLPESLQKPEGVA